MDNSTPDFPALFLLGGLAAAAGSVADFTQGSIVKGASNAALSAMLLLMAARNRVQARWLPMLLTILAIGSLCGMTYHAWAGRA